MLDKAKIEKANLAIKKANENKVYKLALFENYKVVKFGSQALLDLQKLGFTDLEKPYVSSRKYSTMVVDIVVEGLKSLGYTQAEE